MCVQIIHKFLALKVGLKPKNKSRVRLLNLVGIFFLLSLISVGFVWQLNSQIVQAADGTPSTMGFTGRLKDSNGTPLNGNYDLVIKLYDAVAGGNLIWGKSYTNVPVSAGFFTVILGNGDYSEADSGSPLYSNFGDVPFDENYYLATKVESDAEMTPRTPVSTVPFSYTTRALQPLGSAPASPEAGWIYFDSTGGDLRPYVYNGTSWLAMTLAGHTFTGDVTGTLDADDSSVLTFNTSALLSGDHVLAANAEKFGLSGLIFEGSTADSIEAYIAVSDPTLTDKTYTFSGASGTVLTDANFTTSLDGTYVNVGESPTGGDISGSFSGGLVIGANTVDLGTDTVGNYIETLSTSVLTGLTGGAAGSEGTDITVGLDYSQALSGSPGLAANATVFGVNGMVVEGDTADSIEFYLDFPDAAGADKTLAFRDASGTVLISGDTLTGDVTATFDTDGSTSTTIADNSVDGTDIALGSDTEGDVMYYDGTNWVRLGIGTPGEVLEVNAGGTAPEWNTDDSGSTITGADTQVVFFDGIDNPAGDGGLTYNKTSNALTIGGSADGTDGLILTLGDILISDGDLDLSGGDLNVTLDSADEVDITKTAAAAATEEALDITFTAGAGDGADVYSALRAVITSANHSASTDKVYGLNLANLTSADAEGEETAIFVGTGWDNIINSTNATLTNDGALTLGTTGSTTAITITDTDFTNSLSIADNNITGTTFNLIGTDAVINFNDFDVSSDGLVTFASDGAGDQITAVAGNADYQFLVLDNTTVDSTNTSGIIDLNVDAGNAAVDVINIGLTGVNGLTAATDVTGVEILVTGDDADADYFGQTITFAATANATTGTYEAGIFIDNAENTAASLNDGILITSSGASGGVVDGLDVSATNITNAINVGDNTILGTTAVIDFTDFDVDADGFLVFASDGAGDQITMTGANADYQALVVNATGTANTNTAGLIDLNIAAGNAAVNAIDIAFTGNTGTTAAVDQTGINILMTGDDADADFFGSKITFAATANATTGTYEAGIWIDNAENTAASLNDGILITSSGASGGVVDGVDVSATAITNAINVGDNTILGTTAVIDFTDFDMDADGFIVLASDGAGDQITATSANADYQFLVVNATATDVTNTSGLIDLNVDAGNAAVDVINIALTGVNGLTGAVDVTGIETLITGDDADADYFGQTITFAATANATTGTYEAGIFIDNAENTAASLNDGILITSSGASGGVVDGLDVSATNITNAINVGDNTILGTTAVIDFTDFDMDADAFITLASDGAGDQITATSANADYQFLVVNATATDVTNTAGLIDLNVDAGNAAVDVINIGLTGVNGLATATDVTGVEILITGDDADADYFGQTITFAATANATLGTYEAGIFIDNAENTASSLNDGILITSSGSAGGVVDGLDVSASNITNAINIGDNNLIGTTAVINFEDFDMSADGLLVFTSDTAGDQITAASGNADYQFLVLDAETVDVTNTEGLIDLNVDFGDHSDLVVASAISINMETAAAGITANRDFAGINLQMYATNVDADHFGIRIIGESANGTNDYEAALYIDNADLDVGSMQDGIVIYASGGVVSGEGNITDAIDVSDQYILNALNIGSNNITGTTATIDFTKFDLDANGGVTIADGGKIDLSAVDPNTTTEGLFLPLNNSSCWQATAEGQTCWDHNTDELYVGNGASATLINSAGGATPGGLDTYVQYNDSGAFGGDSGMTFNEGTDTLTVGALTVTTDLTVSGGDITGANGASIDVGELFAGGIHFTASGAADYSFGVDDDTSVKIGGGTVTNTNESIDLLVTLGNDADADTVTGLKISMTTASTGDADIFQGMYIADLAGSNGTPSDRALQIGTGWDADIFFADTSPTIVMSGNLTFTDASGNDMFRIIDNGSFGDIYVPGGDITSANSGSIDLGEANTNAITFAGAVDYIFDTTTGQVGIGLTGPTALLHISDASAVASGAAALESFKVVSGTGGTSAATSGGVVGGAGGALTIDSGTGGSATGSSTNGNTVQAGPGGTFLIRTGAGGATNGNPNSSGGNTYNIGGVGGALTIDLGDGGASSGNGAGTVPGKAFTVGGIGGTFTLDAGAGGSGGTADGGIPSESATGGGGGALILRGGVGGSGGVANAGAPGGNATGGIGGAVTITAGTGGDGGTGGGTNVGGVGGALSLAGGQGGAGGETNGSGGSIYLYGGLDGSGDGDDTGDTTGGILYLGARDVTGTPTATSRVFINTPNATTTAALCHTDGTGVSEVVDCNGSAGDYMEMYPTEDGVETGDVVSIGSQDVTTIHGENIKQLVKSANAYDSKVIGIASDPAMAGDFNSQGYNLNPEDNPYPIALNGRVKVKISTTSDDIAPGDMLTTSTEAGRAMKSTQPGQVIGKALEAWSAANPTDTIMVFVTTSYFDANSSSVKYKTNIGGLTFGLQDLMKLRPVLFDWNNTGEQDLGFIAEEVADVNPLLAAYDSNGNVEGVRYKLMSVLLTKSVQEQQMQIEAILAQLGMTAAQIDAFADAANPVTIADPNEFTGTIKVKGAAVFGEDSVGQARILAGSDKVEIKFKEAYAFQPIVTLTMRGEEALNTSVKYTVVNETNEGFEIKLNIAHYENLDFNWHAFGAYEGKIFVSDGTTENITLVVKDQPVDDPSNVAVQPPTPSGSSDTIVDVVDSIEDVAVVDSPTENEEAAGDTEVSVDESSSESNDGGEVAGDSSGDSSDNAE